MPTPESSPPVHLLCGTSSGGRTLDSGEGGGNPFASALIELLGRNELTFGDLARDIIPATRQKSGGFQTPELILLDRAVVTPTDDTICVALVVVFVDYSKSQGASSLPGADRDARRVCDALDAAGFRSRALIDPDADELNQVLLDFAAESQSADIALIYTTGHGVEVEGEIYLLPGNYPTSRGKEALEDHAIPLTRLSENLRASERNYLFYAGCRNAPFQ